MLNRWCADVFLVAAIACGGGSTGTATSPSPTPTTPTAFSLSGTVIDSATSTPIAGAAVSLNARYRATTDSSGHYGVTGLLDTGLDLNVTSVSANNYASDVRSIHRTSQTVRLHRIERMVAGDSTVVAVAPDDTLCVNTLQDTLGLGPDYVCRGPVPGVDGDGEVAATLLPPPHAMATRMNTDAHHRFSIGAMPMTSAP